MYNDVFGNSTLPPSEFSYSALNITVDTTLVWPYNTDGGSPVSKIMDVECAAGNAITLPSAMEVSVGEDFLLRNVGGNLLEIKNAGGVTIGTVLAGAASYFYLTDNTTVAGVFGAVDFGVGTSSADAGTLVGAGIKAVGPTLNQSHPVVPTSGTLTVDGTHRAKAVVYTGGADTFNLTSAVTLGDDYFVLIRNNGTGTLVIDPAGAELIDGQANLTVQPSESLILICTGTTWYSVGYGRSTLYQFTQLTKDVSAGGTITLTAAEASNKLITFIGNPAVAVTVIVPAVVSVYYTYSNITTAQTVTLKTASGSGVGISQGARIIAICDATSVLSAQSAVANSSVSLTDGSAAVPALFFATQTNTGLYKFSTNGLGITIAGTSVVTVEATGLRTPQQISTSVSTGTAPFIVASTTKVDNLHVARATIADSATTNANLTGPITSVGNATSVASQTGTGSTFVMNNSPTLVTPVLGVATATSINKLAITTPATGSTLSIADAKTFTVSNTVTLASTDGATLAIGGGGTLASMAYQSATAVNIDGGTIDGTVIGGTTPAAGSFTTLSATGALTTNGLKEDAAGNLGLGVTPSAHLPAGYGGPILQVGGRASIMGSATTAAYSNNTYYSEGFFRHIGDAPATMQEQINGQFNFYTAPSGTAGNPITFTQAMTLDASGNLLVGATSGSSHTVLKDVTVDAGNAVLLVGTPGGAGTFYGTSGTGQNGANATMRFGKDAVTNRTLNAAGTINASGADYAEYERNNGLTFAKGDIVGFKADGTLTNIFAEAIRFGLKSTNPSYVGGDTWGSEDQVGTRPEQPIRKLDKTEQKVISDGSDEIVDEEGNVVSEAVDAITETVVIALGDTDAEWEAVEAKYQADLTEFNERLEAARQQVDRVAYSGKVPVNVFGAVPGGYIIAAANDASITGQFVQDPDFAQYKRAVGRVNRILEDGRCEVAVMVH